LRGNIYRQIENFKLKIFAVCGWKAQGKGHPLCRVIKRAAGVGPGGQFAVQRCLPWVYRGHCRESDFVVGYLWSSPCAMVCRGLRSQLCHER
jgi:hypothetical protein